MAIEYLNDLNIVYHGYNTLDGQTYRIPTMISKQEYVTGYDRKYMATTGATTSEITIPYIRDNSEKISKKEYFTTRDYCYSTVTNPYLYYNAEKKTATFFDLESDWSITWHETPKTAAERLREIIRSRQSPSIITQRRSLSIPQDIRESRARETLLRVVGQQKFRNFIKHGFITVRGASGKVYQIFTGEQMTCVYDGGKMVERLCVVLEGDFPPTDSLIMRYLLILNDEEGFRNRANAFAAHTKVTHRVEDDDRPLVQIFSEMKAA